MPWGRVDDQSYDHRKLDKLPAKDRLPAIGLYWLSISWCNRHLTDGFVPDERLVKLAELPRATTFRLRDRLVAAELFDRAQDGVRIHDYFEEGRNKSREQVEKERDEARQRMKRLRNGSGRVRENETANVE